MDAVMESIELVVGRLRPPGALVVAPVQSSEWLHQSCPSGHAGEQVHPLFLSARADEEKKETTMLWFVPGGAGLVSAGTYLATLIATNRNMSDPPRREALHVLEL